MAMITQVVLTLKLFFSYETASTCNDYLKKLKERVQKEISSECHALEEKWAISHLKKNEWWFLPKDSEYLCNKLGLKHGMKACCKKIFAWLPDERWGLTGVQIFPTCKSSESVGAHSFQPGHHGRQVIDMNNTCFWTSRKCRCHSYHRKHLHVQSIANTENNDSNLEKNQHSFVGYNKETISLLPCGYGLLFPDFFKPNQC